MAMEVKHIYIFEDCIYTKTEKYQQAVTQDVRLYLWGAAMVSKVQSPASPVCQMRLSAVAPSLYDLSFWWDVKHKT